MSVISGWVRCHHVRGVNGRAPSTQPGGRHYRGLSQSAEDWDSITAGFHTTLVTKLMGASAEETELGEMEMRWRGVGRRRRGNEKGEW